MAAGGEARPSDMADQDEFLIEDIGTVLINVAKRSIPTFKHNLSVRDQSLQVEPVTVEEEELGFSIKVDITNYKQAFNLYEVMAEKTYTYYFKPSMDRILFDSKVLHSSSGLMFDLVAHCRRFDLDIVKLDPRKRLGLECFCLEDIYKLSSFCINKSITDGKFYTTNLEVVTKRESLKRHQVRYTDYEGE